MAALLRQADAPPTTTLASLDDLTVTANRSNFITPDHGQPNSGFQMPAQMMPDMPLHGEQQLNLVVTLTNTGDSLREFRAKDEFVLRGGREDVATAPRSTTLGKLSRLTPGSAVNTVLYFHVPTPKPSDPPLYLEWSRDGDTTRLAVPSGKTTGAPGHEHAD
ncbi:MAG: hypothetical protein ACRDPK_10305 [Carbonactinosporaceae bacterium]